MTITMHPRGEFQPGPVQARHSEQTLAKAPAQETLSSLLNCLLDDLEKLQDLNDSLHNRLVPILAKAEATSARPDPVLSDTQALQLVQIALTRVARMRDEVMDLRERVLL